MNPADSISGSPATFVTLTLEKAHGDILLGFSSEFALERDI